MPRQLQSFVLAITAGAAACSSTRSVTVSAARPVVLMQGHCPICEGRGPCRFTFSRETCFGYDSSTGFIQFKAVLPDGRCQILSERTCDLKEDQRIHFDLEQSSLRDDRLTCGVDDDGKPWTPSRRCPPQSNNPP